MINFIFITRVYRIEIWKFIFYKIIEHLYKNQPIDIENVLDNVFLTGPGMVTNLYNKLKPNVKLNHNKIVVKYDLDLYKEIYGIHFCSNTWVGKKYHLNK